MNFDHATLQKLYRYAYSLSKDKEASFDLLHNAIEAYLKRPPLDETKAIAYVRSIIRNRYIDEFRHTQRFPGDSIDDHSLIDVSTSTLEGIVIAEHDMALIWDQLNDFDRELLFFWAVEGYSIQEIAEHIDVPRGTLLSRLHRLRQKIITSMADEVDAGGYSE